MKKETLAFDTKRHKDINGYLHVEVSPLTKETVNPYYGREIPGWEDEGLDPEKIYYGYRAEDELKKALNTFNGIPVLDKHKLDSAERPLKEERVGYTGTNAYWEAPYIMNGLIITDAAAIELIESNKQRELSASYRYKPVFQSGYFNGEKYDFIMTEIQANHIALVAEGRAGSDVLVYDKQLEGASVFCEDCQIPERVARNQNLHRLGSRSPSQPPQLLGTASARACRSAAEDNNINKNNQLEQRTFTHVRSDTLPKGEGGKGENGISPFQKKGENEMAKNVEELKQALDGLVQAFNNFLDEEAKEPEHASDSEYKEAMDAAGCDSENEAEQKAFAEGVKYGEELMRNPEKRKKIDSKHESEGEKKALGEDEDNYKEAMDKAGCDSENEAEQKAFAEGVKYGEKLIRNPEERKKIDSEHESKGEKKAEAASDKAISKAAFDNALKQAELRGAERATKHIKELYDAASKVKRTVTVNPLAYDSAADIYKAALKKEGADISGVDKSAYASLYNSIMKNKSNAVINTAAFDSKPDEDNAFSKIKQER